MATVLDGLKCAKERAEILKSQIKNLKQKGSLAIISVGKNQAKEIYIGKKVALGKELGVDVKVINFDTNISEKEILDSINELNNNFEVKGIIVQMPVLGDFDIQKIIDTIDPKKDIDGLTSRNLGLLLKGQPQVVSATTKGIITLLANNNISVSGKKVVIVGRSILVGKPTALAMLNLDATVTLCHSKTTNLESITSQADVLISATGEMGLITPKHVNKGQIIIDVGISRSGSFDDTQDKEELIKGDVSDEAKNLVSAYSPVPGGVGPMTVISLFENYFSLFEI